MEIGHNALHGRYDWQRDEALNSRTSKWDVVAPAELWKPSHHFGHNTHTNIVGKDRDIGYWICGSPPSSAGPPTTWATRSTRRCCR